MLTDADRASITRCIDEHGGVCREVMCDDSLDVLIDRIVRRHVRAAQQPPDPLAEGVEALAQWCIDKAAVMDASSADDRWADGAGDAYTVTAARLMALVREQQTDSGGEGSSDG